MRFYMVDDDPNILKILEGIIKKEMLGQVVGVSTSPSKALTGILAHRPDVVLVDYLMPEMHGADLVREITSNLPDIACVIISQVSDKEMIGASYEAGIEFFIQKPINLIEVKRVLTSVIEKIEMKRALNQINGLLQKTTAGLESRISGKQAGHMDRRHNMKKVLSRLGILGEKGAVDVLECACLLLENGIEYGVSDHMNTICEELGQKPKIMKQRMRRSLQNGLRNLATLGIEDYLNDNFTKYSGALYEFEDVKAEMDYVRGKRAQGGRVNIQKFVEALMLESQEELS